MPAVAKRALTDAVLQAIQESGYAGVLISPAHRHPQRFSVAAPDGGRFELSVYIWTLTFGGRPQLPNEFRIQMTGVDPPLLVTSEGPTVLVGYEPGLRLFAGFDLSRHRTFTPGSPSIQVDIEEVKRAETQGLSFHRKSNEEIAVGIRPDQLVSYALSAESIHRNGREPNTFRLLTRAASREQITAEELAELTVRRQRLVHTVTRLSRLASFRQQVLFAYGNRCAITRVQLRLVDAAHILPVGAPHSSDSVRNGIALSPTYHRAFDYGLIYLDDSYRMQVNGGELHRLEQMNLQGGVETFRAPLGRIFLPPDPAQRPASEYIRRANRFRGITT